jgi:hypothetical protein
LAEGGGGRREEGGSRKSMRKEKEEGRIEVQGGKKKPENIPRFVRLLI